MDLTGLPMSSFVPQDEHERLMAAFAATVYEHGYVGTNLSDVALRAGVPLDAVARHWSAELDCLLETVSVFTRWLFNRAAQAFMGAAGDGPVALHAALEAVLLDAARAPEMTYMSVVELPRLGSLAHERLARSVELFSELLHACFAAMDAPPPSPEIIALCIVGGLWETLRLHAAARTLHELPDALPAISYVCVCTFFGRDEALRASSVPSPPR
jgi:AcrR family transcriptional regulator